MPSGSDIKDLEAEHGQKMIELKIRFWTNSIANEKGSIRPGHAWSSGIVRMQKNRAHGIAPGDPLPFNSLLDLPSVIEQALVGSAIKLHPSRKMKRYFSEKP
jgi:hypothetical protein